MDYELIKQTDEITVGTEEEAKALIESFKEKARTEGFEIVSYSTTLKEKKAKGEVIDSYYKVDSIEKKNKLLKSVISYKTTTIKSGGSKQKFVGTFVNENGEEINGVSTNWEIICDFADSLIVNEEGNSLTIGVDDDSLIDEEFKLVLSDESGKYKSSIIIQIGSLL